MDAKTSDPEEAMSILFFSRNPINLNVIGTIAGFSGGGKEPIK